MCNAGDDVRAVLNEGLRDRGCRIRGVELMSGPGPPSPPPAHSADSESEQPWKDTGMAPYLAQVSNHITHPAGCHPPVTVTVQKQTHTDQTFQTHILCITLTVDLRKSALCRYRERNLAQVFQARKLGTDKLLECGPCLSWCDNRVF